MLEYNEYLKSPTWRRRRMKVIRRDNYECVVCGQQGKKVLRNMINYIDVHHETYKYFQSKNPQNEIDHCITICRKCHEGLHMTLKYLKIRELK